MATVGGKPILASRLELELRRRSGEGRLSVDRDAVLQDLIDLEAAYGRAAGSGFLDRPDIQQAIRLMVVERFRGEWEQAHPQASPLTDARIRESYAQRRDRFLRPEAVNLALIRLESPRKASAEKKAEIQAKAVSLADRTRRELGGLLHFGPIAAESSSDQPSRYRGGEQGWMTAAQLRERWPAEVVAAADVLKEPGEISQPIATSDGVFLVRLMGRRAEALRPVDEVRSQIEHELMREARTERDRQWSAESRSGVDVTIHRDVLAKVPVPSPAPETPAAPQPMSPR